MSNSNRQGQRWYSGRVNHNDHKSLNLLTPYIILSKSSGWWSGDPSSQFQDNGQYDHVTEAAA